MSTFAQIQSKVLNYFGVSDSEIQDEIKNAINETIWEINADMPQAEYLQASTTFTCTADTSLVTSGIPSDFDHILSISITENGNKNTPLTYLTRKEWNNLRLFDQGSGTPTHYSIFDGNLYLGIPPSSALTGTIEYYKFAAELTDGSDTTVLSDHIARWEHVIVKGAKAKIHEYLGADAQLIQKSQVDYEHFKRRFRAWSRRNFNKSPNASRMRTWKEAVLRERPLIASSLRP